MVKPSPDMHPPLTDSDWRLLGLDIDGTLLPWGGQIDSQVIAAIEQARVCRNHVILATGRNVLATLPIARDLGIRRGWAVCSNGAVTVRLNPSSPGGYDVVEKVTFNARGVLELIRAHFPDAMYAVEDFGVGFRVTREFPAGELTGRQRVVDDFAELYHDEVTRVVVRAPGVDLDKFEALVHSIGLNDVTYAIGYSSWLDVTPPGVSKASALETLRRQLGVYPDHTVAVGDGNNDIEMLQWAGLGVAMGNATDYVKSFADEVVDNIENHGVLQVLERLIDPDRLTIH